MADSHFSLEPFWRFTNRIIIIIIITVLPQSYSHCGLKQSYLSLAITAA